MRPTYENKRIRRKTLIASSPDALDDKGNEFRKTHNVISEATSTAQYNGAFIWIATVYYEE
jgi:hypothetical protein